MKKNPLSVLGGFALLVGVVLAYEVARALEAYAPTPRRRRS